VELLLDRDADVDARDAEGTTALMEAATYGHSETAALLLERGADVNAHDERGTTALMMAAAGGHREAAALLREWGADVFARDAEGETACVKATRNGHNSTAAPLKAIEQERSLGLTLPPPEHGVEDPSKIGQQSTRSTRPRL
jgi:ankyrin repeat protein